MPYACALNLKIDKLQSHAFSIRVRAIKIGSVPNPLETKAISFAQAAG
jgi:hypothetical protein